MKKKGLSVGKKIVLGLPVLLSGSWIVLLRQGTPLGGEQFAPASSSALLIALLIFTVGYLLFLLLLFSDDLKDMFSKS
tara:strand:+ start:579 stop:812 length:234 start_codon:yes stop_codon:yes gene_type:complete